LLIENTENTENSLHYMRENGENLRKAFIENYSLEGLFKEERC